MDFLAQHATAIFAAIGSVCAAIISVTSFVKALKSEKRTINELSETKKDVKVTREGIVQAFKDSVVTKDLKVSINSQVKRILQDELDKFQKMLAKSEERRTKMTYWCLKILDWTAASGKLTTEQRAEVDELLAMIADEEQIVDTDVK